MVLKVLAGKLKGLLQVDDYSGEIDKIVVCIELFTLLLIIKFSSLLNWDLSEREKKLYLLEIGYKALLTLTGTQLCGKCN